MRAGRYWLLLRCYHIPAHDSTGREGPPVPQVRRFAQGRKHLLLPPTLTTCSVPGFYYWADLEFGEFAVPGFPERLKLGGGGGVFPATKPLCIRYKFLLLNTLNPLCYKCIAFVLEARWLTIFFRRCMRATFQHHILHSSAHFLPQLFEGPPKHLHTPRAW